MPTTQGKRLRRFLLIAAAAALIAPGAAQAHRLTTVAVDYRVRVLAPPSGVQVAARDGGRKLELVADPAATVVVFGYANEPFLRFAPAGVLVSSSSPTAEAAGLVGGGSGWVRLTAAHRFAWADQRTVPKPEGGGHTRWSIPLIADGRRTAIFGESWRPPGPATWPWLAGGLVLLLAAVVVLHGHRDRWRKGSLLLAGVAGAATTVSLAGLALADIGSPAARWFQAIAVAAIAVGGIAIALRRRGAAFVALGAVGVVAVLEAIAQLGVFRHPVVLSALPASVARLAVVVGLTAGLAAVAVTFFQADPVVRR